MARNSAAGPVRRHPSAVRTAGLAVGAGTAARCRAGALAAPPSSVSDCRRRPRTGTATAAAAGTGAGLRANGPAGDRPRAGAAVIGGPAAGPVPGLARGPGRCPGPAAAATGGGARATIDMGNTGLGAGAGAGAGARTTPAHGPGAGPGVVHGPRQPAPVILPSRRGIIVIMASYLRIRPPAAGINSTRCLRPRRPWHSPCPQSHPSSASQEASRFHRRRRRTTRGPGRLFRRPCRRTSPAGPQYRHRLSAGGRRRRLLPHHHHHQHRLRSTRMLTSSKEGERAGRTAAAGGGSGDCGRRGKVCEARPDGTHTRTACRATG